MSSGHILKPWRSLGHCPHVTDDNKYMEGCGLLPGTQCPCEMSAITLGSLGFLDLAQPGTRLPFMVLQKSKDNLQQLVLSFYALGFRDQNHVFRLVYSFTSLAMPPALHSTFKPGHLKGCEFLVKRITTLWLPLNLEALHQILIGTNYVSSKKVISGRPISTILLGMKSSCGKDNNYIHVV